jgi:hypothetical protein
MSQRVKYKTPAEILDQLMIDDDSDDLPDIPVSSDEEEEEETKGCVCIMVRKPYPPSPPPR